MSPLWVDDTGATSARLTDEFSPAKGKVRAPNCTVNIFFKVFFIVDLLYLYQ